MGTDTTIQLSHGVFNLQGRVEVRKNGIWGTVCNDNTDERNWDSTPQAVDDRAAEVICRQMGFTVGRLIELSIVADGTHQIWLDNLNCADWPSTKDHVEQCQHNDKDDWQWGDHNCSHSQDVVVGCDAADSTSTAGA